MITKLILLAAVALGVHHLYTYPACAISVLHTAQQTAEHAIDVAKRWSRS